MDNKNESNKIIEQQTEYGLQMVPLAYVEMVETRHTKEKTNIEYLLGYSFYFFYTYMSCYFCIYVATI